MMDRLGNAYRNWLNKAIARPVRLNENTRTITEGVAIQLVVDRSSSMSESGQWGELKSALSDLAAGLDDVIDFGLMLFPSPQALFNACIPGQVVVEPQPNAGEAIRTALQISPFGGTPTAMSLYAVRDVLLAASSTVPKSVILATDGGPGCNSSLDTRSCTCIPGAFCGAAANCLDDVRTLQAVRDLANQGIPTFVIGVPGTEAVVGLLDNMATNGGTAVEGHHYGVRNQEQLQAALRATSGSMAPCTYELPTTVTAASDLRVVLDGQVLDRDAQRQNGWDVVEGATLAFFGSACAALRDGAGHMITGQYDCRD
jgi:Mg-chelatase subunit ChlD